MLTSLRSSRFLFKCSKFSTRMPGRIFGSQDQQSSSFDASSPSQSSSFEGTDKMSQRKPSFNEVSEQSAILAFSEEALQDYSLSAFAGMSSSSFSDQVTNILSEPLDDQLIEIKPDGSCYLPEVHYRRILTKAFGISGWSLIPRGPHSIQGNVLSREYALFANGRYISQARGHTTISGNFQNPAMCTESVRSNSLMRCCKDLGIAASLWDNSVTSQWKNRYAVRKGVSDYQGRTKYVWEKRRNE